MVESGPGSRYLSKTMPTFGRFVPAILLLAALSAGLEGCARRGDPAPVTFGGGDAARATTPDAPATRGPVVGGGGAVVQSGDTLYSIARRSGVPIRAVIDANGLQAPFNLQPGQAIVLPRVRTHQVASGDTVFNIARRYSVPQSELVRANSIDPPFTIQLGRVLVVPDTAGSPLTDSATTIAAAPAPPRDADVTGGGALPAPPPAPPPAPTVSAPSPVNGGDRAVRGIDAAPLPPQGNSASAPNVAPNPPPPAPTTSAAPTAAAIAPPAARAGRGFAWPVRGRVVSDFGPKPGGLHNDGFNIAAPRGTPFHAAENGVVVYAGNELRGFGNLILVRHDGGWVTAYAHADEIAARRGDQVRRGQVLGKVGQTGNVASPQLHFEIRRGTRAVDPRELMSGGSASG